MKAAAVDPMNPFRTAGAARMLEALGHTQAAQAQLDEAAKQQQPNLWTAVAKFDLLFNASRFADAAACLDTPILADAADLSAELRSLLRLPAMSREDLVGFFETTLGAGPLDLIQCERAAHFGCSDLAFEHLFAALDAARPIAGLRWNAFGLPHAVTLSSVFGADGKAFRADRRFPAFCARIGLVDHWRTSGHWPDCATEVPYDFKTA